MRGLLPLPIIDWGEQGSASTYCPISHLPGPALKWIHTGIHAGWSSSWLRGLNTYRVEIYGDWCLGRYIHWVHRFLEYLKSNSSHHSRESISPEPALPVKFFYFSINILLTLFLANECPDFLGIESIHSFPAQSYFTMENLKSNYFNSERKRKMDQW